MKKLMVLGVLLFSLIVPAQGEDVGALIDAAKAANDAKKWAKGAVGGNGGQDANGVWLDLGAAFNQANDRDARLRAQIDAAENKVAGAMQTFALNLAEVQNARQMVVELTKVLFGTLLECKDDNGLTNLDDAAIVANLQKAVILQKLIAMAEKRVQVAEDNAKKSGRDLAAAIDQLNALDRGSLNGADGDGRGGAGTDQSWRRHVFAGLGHLRARLRPDDEVKA